LFTSVKEIFRTERERTVPAHLTLLHYLGALALLFFIMEVATGILLMIYYRPSAGAAYYSTGIIMDEVRLGWLVRSVHRWGADLLILLVLLHMIRVYFARAYQAPRQLNWVMGICLLVLLVALGFTGILLPWDQYAYWYMDSARTTIANIPVLGNLLLALLWGGWEISEEVLLRFYALHVGVLPWLAITLLFLHLALVWRFGVQEPAGARTSASPPTPFFPDFVVNLFIAALLTGGWLLTVAVCFPPTLLERADPLVPLVHAQPRWYLLPVRELLRGLPGGWAALAVLAFFVLLFLVPVLDRRAAQPTWKQVVHRSLGLLVIVTGVLLGVRAYLR
jgi:cytochrome b6